MAAMQNAGIALEWVRATLGASWEEVYAEAFAVPAGGVLPQVRLVARDLPEPSALAHEVLNSAPWAYLDDAPLEERRSRAVSLRRTLPEKDGDLGALDPAAIAEVAAQAWPEVRDARDLHDALLCLGLLPDAEVPAGWRDPLAQLASAGRAVRHIESAMLGLLLPELPMVVV